MSGPGEEEEEEEEIPSTERDPRRNSKPIWLEEAPDDGEELEEDGTSRRISRIPSSDKAKARRSAGVVRDSASAFRGLNFEVKR